MVKNNVLTPVLAGVLGLSLVGGGVGFYMMNKNSSDNGDSGNGSTSKTSPKLSVMAQNIDNTFEKAEKAAKGELDYSNKAVVKMSFGPAMQKEAGVSYKDIEIDLNAKQKGGNQEVQAQFMYDGKNLISVNEVLQREGDDQIVYVQVPELSDAYLKMDQDALDELMEQSSGMGLNNIEDTVGDVDFDVDAFSASLDGYEKAIKDNFPTVKSEEKKDGDIDGVSYSYTAKSYDITGADAKNIAVACMQQAKTDSFIKSYYDVLAETENEAMRKYDPEYSMPTYEEQIDEAIKELNEESFEGDGVLQLVTYEDKNGEFTGFEITSSEEEGLIKFIGVSTDEAEGVDMLIDVEDVKVSCYGALKLENDAINGGYTLKAEEDGDELMSVSYTFNELKAVGDTFTGSVRLDAKVEDESLWWELASNSKSDNVDVTMELGYNGESMMTISVTSEATEASDVTVPSGKIFDYSDEAQLDEYLEGCDVDGLAENAKSVLGEELYDELFGTPSYDWDDDDFDWEEWDDDDFDWEQFDTEEFKGA